MVSDSVVPNAAIPSAPKDFAKKKRAHRSAKLKQCKLDARREQWLSQGAVKNKGGKEEVTGPRAASRPYNNEGKNALENLDMRRGGGGGVGEEENENGLIHHDIDSESHSLSSISSSILGGNDSGTNFTASSSSSGGCCSGSITEEEGEGEDDNGLDDWEAVADALAANDDNKQESQNESSYFDSDSSPTHEPTVQLGPNSNNFHSTPENLKQEHGRTVGPSLTSGNNQAWRPDDAFRPQSLPNLSKQRSFPNTDRQYGKGALPWARANSVNVPSSCPICYEDLDFTDASFLPCLCGFHLCLFCHKRILEEDGRCPGCRKPYELHPVEAEASVRGGSLTFKLARSCSMITRS